MSENGMKRWIKWIALLVILFVAFGGITYSERAVPPVSGAAWPWQAASYSFNSAQEQGWRVQVDVNFETAVARTYPYPSLRNVQVNCWVPWSIFYRIEILECSRNFGGWPTLTKLDGRWASIYRPGVKFRACFGIKDFGEVCGTFASVKPVHNYIDDAGGYTVWATQHRSF